MTMEFVNEIENQHNEQEVGYDDTTCMVEYFETIVFLDVPKVENLRI